MFVAPGGRPVREAAVLQRIRSLAIPPAWRDVWICARPDGHLQATGRDAKGRKQYRYHPRWRELRDRGKFDRLAAFGAALPRLRRRVARDLARPGLSREKVLATVVRLLQLTHLRVGNEEYARENGSFGLTTLRGRHVRVDHERLRFRFPGKSGRTCSVDLVDRRLARIVRRCQQLPGQELFQFVGDDGELETVDSGDVNAYLREISGEEFTAKEFRTWAGTVFAACALRELARKGARAGTRRNVVRAVDDVAARLGNTRAVCRKSYIHPHVVRSYLEGEIIPRCDRRGRRASRGSGLTADERAVLHLLRTAPPEETLRLAS